MKPTGIAALVVAALALFVSVVQMARVESRMAAVEARAAKLEGAAPGPSAPPVAAPARDFSREIATLRADVEALKARSAGAGTPVTPGTTPANGGTAGQEAAKRVAEEKLQKEWQERQVRALADTLETKLGLSAQQKVGVSEALARGYQGMADERKAGPSSESMKDLLARAGAKINEEISALLTPEQQSIYSQLTSGPAGIFGVPPTTGGGRQPGESAMHK